LLKDADASRLAKTRPTAAYFGQVRAGSQVSNPEVQPHPGSMKVTYNCMII
jgi:hypothetical protein